VWKSDGCADRFGLDPENTGFGQTSEDVLAMPKIPLSELMAYFHVVRVVTRQYRDHASDVGLLRE